MPKTTVHTPEELHKLLICDPVEGRLTWKPRSPEMFSHCGNPEAQCSSWNTTYAGKPAFATPATNGYWVGTLESRQYLAHRVVYAMATGAWPDRDTDHINGNRADNRISNLRDVTRSENLRNAARSAGNKSGTTGVFCPKAGGKWLALITVNNKLRRLGSFTNKKAAIAARKEAEKLYGFHPNHGREPCQS